MEEKFLKIGEFKIKCIEYYDYNDHYSVTMYKMENDEPIYLDELMDCRLSHNNLEHRVKEYVNKKLM